MTEPAARAFLAERAGTKVCVAYRTDREGRLRLQRTRTPAWAVLAALAMALSMAPGCGTQVDWATSEYPRDVGSLQTEGCPVRAPTTAVRISEQDPNVTVVDFDIDPEVGRKRLMGVMIVDDRWSNYTRTPDRLRYEPTRDLIFDLATRRELLRGRD